MRVLPLPIFLVVSLFFLEYGSIGEAAGASGWPVGEATQVSSSVYGDAERIGTISATLDGEERTWYALVGTINGEKQASSFWYRSAVREGPVAAIGGYDTPDVDFSTFEFSPGAGQVSFGSYDGSLLTLTFPFTLEQTAASMPISDAAEAETIYLKKADFEAEMQTNYYYMSDGQLELTHIEVQEGGPCRFAGTFSGTLTRMDEATRMKVENGSFDIDGCLYMELEQ